MTLERVLPPHNLPYRLQLLSQLLTRRFQGLLSPYDITPLHWGVLSCLWRLDGQPTQSIAAKLEQLGGTVTVGLDAMEKRRLIRRKPDSEDRRISRVWLTKKGKELEIEIVPKVEEFVSLLFAPLTEFQYTELSTRVDQIRNHVENLPSHSGF